MIFLIIKGCGPAQVISLHSIVGGKIRQSQFQRCLFAKGDGAAVHIFAFLRDLIGHAGNFLPGIESCNSPGRSLPNRVVGKVLMPNGTGAGGDIPDVNVIADRRFGAVGMEEALLIDPDQHWHRLRASVPDFARKHRRRGTALRISELHLGVLYGQQPGFLFNLPKGCIAVRVDQFGNDGVIRRGGHDGGCSFREFG